MAGTNKQLRGDRGGHQLDAFEPKDEVDAYKAAVWQNRRVKEQNKLLDKRSKEYKKIKVDELMALKSFKSE